MSDVLTEQRTIAYVRFAHHKAHDGSYSWSEDSVSVPVDITDMDLATAERALTDAMNGVKMLALEHVGVEYEFQDGVVVPLVQPNSVAKEGSNSKFDKPAATTNSTAGTVAALPGAFSVVLKNPKNNENNGKTPPDWLLEALAATGKAKGELWVYDHSDHPNANHPRYKLSKKSAEYLGIPDGYWAPK